ncbi:hypothetical protein NLI96_g6697 [Meripilus lineatus]|uniref:F-box domain-containing protein n=1 Tax=Meripilus lineatus TaxID=2056292 RepID=A0AAD5V5S1_9APHY|nr:hypothetical protein NLI96_g6697 [Physisporinus lineatus]
MISHSLAVPSNDPSSHQNRDRTNHEVKSSTHKPAVDGQTTLVMYPRVERVGWARSIELDVMERLRQMERGTTWHPVVHTSTQPNSSISHSRIRLPPPNPTPRLPPEILELVLQSIRPGIDTIYDNIPVDSFEEAFRRQEDPIGTLATCCYVCRRWVALCQELLFSWVILQKYAHLDSLFHLHRTSRLSHISHLIRRISVAYNEPNDKLGEALPRIATMAPPNLLHIDVAPDLAGEYDTVNFPFHDSLPLRVAPLHYVRVLHLHWLKFTNLSEFRQLISCFSGLQVLYFFLDQDWNSEVPRALHQTANPLLTRISAWPYENGLWPWLSPHGSGTGRQSRCSTAQISRTVPSVSAAIVTFMHIIIERMKSTFYPNNHTLDVEWKCKKCAHVDQTQWSLYIRLIYDGPQHPVAISSTVLLKFQAQTNLPHPSFDLSHLVEIRTTIHPYSNTILEDMDTISSMWKHDELIDLDNLERLQIGIHLNHDNPFDKPQMEFMDYLNKHAKKEGVDSASDILAKLERRFETLRDCDRRCELEITVGGSPIDDVLREWKEKIAAVEKEEGAKEEGGAEERAGGAEGAGEGTRSSRRCVARPVRPTRCSFFCHALSPSYWEDTPLKII